MTAAVLAIDGGNSKTDVALVAETGHLLAHVRGPGSSPHNLGIAGSAALLDELVAKAAALAGLTDQVGCADHAGVYLAGVDIPVETAWLRTAIADRRWSPDLVVDNDTLALLRAGTDELDAVAVVCGAGINCVGLAADGRQVRFPSLGRISGDWGGGVHLGEEALWWAARGVDGRGESTVLAELIPEHFGRPDLQAVIEDLHSSRLDSERLGELAPMVLRAGSELGDASAGRIVRQLADEVVVLATTALRRLRLLDQPTVAVLGGGVLTSEDPLLHSVISEGLAAAAPRCAIHVTRVPPVVGAGLWALDRLPATATAEERLRADLAASQPHRM
jgi:N-acetylglucosamine kinase-like BadF-type ATPase